MALLTAAESGAIRLWDVKTETVIATLSQDILELGPHGAHSAAFSPCGKTIVSGYGDGTVDFWSARTYEKVATIQAHSDAVHTVAFSPDGALMATGGWQDTALKVWDVASRQEKHVLYGHAGSVLDFGFSPDGRTIASASDDASVKLWDVECGTLIDSFCTPYALHAVAFSPDRSLCFLPQGKMLVSGGEDNSIRIWPLDDLPGPFRSEDPGPTPRASFVVHARWSMWAAFSPERRDELAGLHLRGSFSVWDPRLSDSRIPDHLRERSEDDVDHRKIRQRQLYLAPFGHHAGRRETAGSARRDIPTDEKHAVGRFVECLSESGSGRLGWGRQAAFRHRVLSTEDERPLPAWVVAPGRNGGQTTRRNPGLPTGERKFTGAHHCRVGLPPATDLLARILE